MYYEINSIELDVTNQNARLEILEYDEDDKEVREFDEVISIEFETWDADPEVGIRDAGWSIQAFEKSEYIEYERLERALFNAAIDWIEDRLEDMRYDGY